MNLGYQTRLFFPAAPAETPFSLHAIGVEEWMAGAVRRPGGTGDWLLMAFEAGNRIGERILDADSVMLWTPVDGHFYGLENVHWVHSWLHFDGDAVERQLRRRGVAAGLTPLSYPIAAARIEALAREYTSGRAVRAEIVFNLFDNLLCELTERSEPEIPAGFQRVRECLERDYAQEFSGTELARMAGYSGAYFVSLFTRYFGLSPRQYQIECRIKAAEYLLSNRNLSLKEISERLHFCDTFYFSRLFRRKRGVSPSEYRKRKAKP